MLRQDDYIKSKLVDVGLNWGSEYGGHLPACMVMSCVANRVHLGWGGWLDVIERIPAYSAQFELPVVKPSIWEPHFVRLLHEVGPIFDGTQDHAKGAVYWCDTRRIETPFFKDKILSQLDVHPRVCESNSLALFR